MEYVNLSIFVPSLNNRSYVLLITVFLTAVLAIGVRHTIHRFQQQSKLSKDPKSTSFDDDCTNIDVIGAKATRQSRLLRKQFGIIEDDLQLQEESSITNNDNISMLVVDEGNSEHSPTDGDGSKLDNISGRKVIVKENLAEAAGAEIAMENSEKSKTSREDEPSQTVQHSFVVVSPPSSPVSTLQNKRRNKELRKSQYERLQEHRRQQMLVAAESRLEQQLQFRSELNLPPLFHFWNWYDTQTSLYRQYTLVRNDGIEDNTTIVPYHPSSRRSDKISIHMRVTNDLEIPISVYWIDHIGKHIPKGDILSHGGTWQQTTYVDHPWIFKATTATGTATADDNSNELYGQLTANGSMETVLLHYIPHQVIPSISDASTETLSDTNTTTGIHRFHIIRPVALESTIYNCTVRDPILPFPASQHILTARKAAEFALQHCLRMRYDKWVVLQKYVRNIIEYPNDLQYRCIRIANAKFSDSVWNTPAKGVLLAYNFIEQCDIGYICFGGISNAKVKEGDEPTQLSIATLQELELLLHMIQLSEQKAMNDYG